MDDSKDDLVLGDVLLVRQKPDYIQAQPCVSFEVVRAAFKAGEIYDPVSGRRCKGMEYIDEDRTTKPLEL